MSKEKKLLSQFIFTILTDNKVNIDNDIIDKLADRLIARGYKRSEKLPCKVGDTIYWVNLEIKGNTRKPYSTEMWVSSHKIKDFADCLLCSYQILTNNAFKTKADAQQQCKEWEKEYKNDNT